MSNTKHALCYTVKDLFELIPIGRNSIYRLVNRDDFPKIRIGRKILIPENKLKEYLEKNVGTEINFDKATKTYFD